jgi:hypothetical protein
MKLENQVCLPVQAAKLKALGITAGSALVWMHYRFPVDKKDTLLLTPLAEGVNSAIAHGKHATFFNLDPAFSSAELGELLGSEVRSELEPGIQTHVWVCSSEDYQVAFPGDTEANARAEMLIWLLEKQHRTAEEANQALAAA